jgi:putative heme-binding domain-containing protein
MKGSGSGLPEPDALPPSSAKLLSSMMARAETEAVDGERSPSDRAHSIRLLGCREFEQVQPTLTRLMAPSEPQDVQLATLDVLAEYVHSAIAPLVISGLTEYSPAVSARAIRLLLSRTEWTESYLAAITEGRVSSAQIDMAARTKLLEHRQDAIRESAQKLFSNSPRADVIANYRSVLQRPGDPSPGELVFKRECAACHKVRNEGFEVGPDLASSPSRDIDALLTNILDPNRFVDPAQIQYVIIDQSGRSFTGKIVGETATSVTLTSGKGVHETILRKDIDEFVSTGKSLMPEGLESTISKDEMANLLAFLNQLESAPGTVKPALVGGTRPGSVEP